MFEKLLAHLPYNPQLTKQFSFYARHVRHEASIRRTGLLLIGLVFIVQLFALVHPPQARPAQTVVPATRATATGVTQRLSALNSTQTMTPASRATAQPNDVIEYTLYAHNSGNAVAAKYAMRQDLTGILDHAQLVDLSGGNLTNRGTAVSWKAQDIAVGSTLTHTVTVRLASSYHAQQTDGTLAAIAKLPTIGPLSAVVLTGLVGLLAAYLWARARLLVHESMAVLQTTKSGKL